MSTRLTLSLTCTSGGTSHRLDLEFGSRRIKGLNVWRIGTAGVPFSTGPSRFVRSRIDQPEKGPFRSKVISVRVVPVIVRVVLVLPFGTSPYGGSRGMG